MAMAVRVAMATLLRPRARTGCPAGLALKRRRRHHAAGSPELLIPAEVEPSCSHHALLLGHEPALEEALERRLLLGPEEEGVAGHEVHGRHVEADGLHHVPRQLPEGETHEPGRLDHQVRQPAPQLTAHLCRSGEVDLRLLCLHGLQLLHTCGVALSGSDDGQRLPHRNGLLDCLDDLQLASNTRQNVPTIYLAALLFQGRSIKRKSNADRIRLHPLRTNEMQMPQLSDVIMLMQCSIQVLQAKCKYYVFGSKKPFASWSAIDKQFA